MTIEEEQRRPSPCCAPAMTDDQIETALDALFPPSPGPTARESG
jgi:hypothetical protein